MRSMTFRDMAKQIESMTDEQKDCDISVYYGDVDEFFPIECQTRVVTEGDLGDGVLDIGHPYLIINA